MSTTELVVMTALGRIPVTVTRKRIKNLNLRVHPDGSVSLSIPQRVSLARAQDFLDRRSAWIAAHVARSTARAAEAARLAAAPDATVPLWGALVPAPGDSRAVDERYRREVTRALPEVVRRAEELVGVHAAGWQVRRMTSRWGSCTPARRTIRISSTLAAYPRACLTYVVIHELVHLIEPSHNARFHALVNRFCPESDACRALLRRPARDIALSARPADSR